MDDKEIKEFWEQVDAILSRSIENSSQSIFDNYIKENAKKRNEVGISSKIVRKLQGETCEWCRALAGVYEYGQEPSEVYQRHDNCDCTVEYFSTKGRQNVWDKSWIKENELDKKKRISYMISNGTDKNNYYEKISKIDNSYNTKYGINNTLKRRKEIGNYDYKNIKIPINSKYFNHADHLHEIETSKTIYKLFGGKMEILKELNIDNIKTSDLLWNGKKWEIKNISTEKAANSSIRKGLKQIENGGGIILDYTGKELEINKLISEIDNRMLKSKGIGRDIEILVIRKGIFIMSIKY